MEKVKEIAAQGDVLFRRVKQLPANARPVPRKGPIVVAHSETGHNHEVNAFDACHFEDPSNPLVCYLQMGNAECDVVHMRGWDTHTTLRLLGQPGDVWEVRRQREWTPEGWRRVED